MVLKSDVTTRNGIKLGDGMTILRFVRGYGSGAGLEYDVAAINESLCMRHQLHIIQVHMARPGDSLERLTVPLGKGRLTTIPLLREVLPVTNTASDSRFAEIRTDFKDFVRDSVLFHPLVAPLYTRLALRNPPPFRPGDVQGVGATFNEILKSQPVNCIAIHAGGGRDAWEAIQEAARFQVPVVMQLHFANERFKDLSVRLQVAQVNGVGGVSDVRIPAYLRSRFTNLLTAVDSQFFSRESAAAFQTEMRRPLLVLPARIVPNKGQADLIEIVRLLRSRGKFVTVAFSGRVDQPEFEAELRHRIAEVKLEDSFKFLGLLSPAKVRDLMAVSDCLVFPTYHAEGLPRILLEAQAMELPVAVYDTGGCRAGLIPGETGFLVPTGNVEELANAVERIIDSPDRAAAIGERGRKFVTTRFTLNALADRHEAFLNQAFSDHRF